MTQRTRILIAAGIILLITVLAVGAQYILTPSSPPAGSAEPISGAVPVMVGGELGGSFTPEDLGKLTEVSFKDAEEGKEQSGWLLKDVLLLYLDQASLTPDTTVKVSSAASGKSAALTWAEIADPDNMVMFDLSGRGTLKLISKSLPGLDTRAEWVQDVDLIEVSGQ